MVDGGIDGELWGCLRGGLGFWRKRGKVSFES